MEIHFVPDIKSETNVIGHPRSPNARDRGNLSCTICP